MANSSRSALRTHHASPPATASAKTVRNQRPVEPEVFRKPKLMPGFHTIVSPKNGVNPQAAVGIPEAHRDQHASGRSGRRTAPASLLGDLVEHDDREREAVGDPAVARDPQVASAARSIVLTPPVRPWRPTRPPRRRRAGTGPDSADREPTSGRTRQERAHLRPCAAQRLDRDAATPSRRKAPAGPSPSFSSAWLVRNTSAASRPSKAASSVGIGDPDHRRGLQRRADALLAPLDLQRAGDHAGAPARPWPSARPRPRCASRRACRGKIAQRVGAGVREARRPGLLHGEGEQRREPDGQPLEHRVHHRAAGAAAQAVGPVAIEGVPADVEVQGRQVVGAEVGQRPHTRPGTRSARRRARTWPSSSHSRCRMNRSSGGMSARPTRSARRRSRPARPADSGRCCAACDRRRPWSAGWSCRSAGPRRSRPGATHRRRISAPISAITSCGSVVLPLRLRHLLAVLVEGEAVGQDRLDRARGRACRRLPAASDWNQPRCWSEPSR